MAHASFSSCGGGATGWIAVPSSPIRPAITAKHEAKPAWLGCGLR